MKKSALFLLLLTIVLCSPFKIYAQKLPQKPQEVGVYVRALVDSMRTHGQKLGAQIGLAVNTRDFSIVEPARKDVDTYLDSCKARVQQIKDFEGMAAFKTALLTYIDAQKTASDKLSAPFEKFNEKTPAAEINAAIKKIKENPQTEGQKALEALNEAMKKFAAQNNIQVRG